MHEPPDEQASTPSALIPVAPGDKLLERLRVATRGEFEIYGELGRGGMATVYLAHEISLDRKVAIKVMAPGMVHSPGLVERFKREARTAANLSHPNIIPIYAVREAEDLLFCVIKLVKGTPLEGIMRQLGRLPTRMVQAVLAQVGDALEYAHRHKVVHRDIKPGNILIDEDGWAVVTDFGIAKVSEVEALTHTGVAVGTPTYMSPEQSSGGDVSGASDQYSLGVVAYEMLAGQPPFTGTSMMSILYSHFHDAPTPLSTVRPDCPPALCDAIMRMLAKDPADRWPSMADAIAAMGAQPLARDDPTRSELITLARTSDSHRILSQVRTPQSPIPLSHRPNDASATLRWRPVVIGVGATILLGAGYLIARFAAPTTLPEGSRVVGESNATPPRTVSSAASESANVSPELAPPGARVRDTISAAATSQRASAPRALRSAPAADSAAPKLTAGQTASSATQPSSLSVKPETRASATADSVPPLRAPVGSVPITTPAQPPNVVAPPVDEHADVRAVINTFARALAARDLATARRVYPAMPNEQREGFEALWKDGGSLTPRWTISDIVVVGNVATARIRGSNAITQRRGPPSEVTVDLRARLERRGSEWRLVALVN